MTVTTSVTSGGRVLPAFVLMLIAGLVVAWLVITYSPQTTIVVAAVPILGLIAGGASRQAGPALLGALIGVVGPISVVGIQYVLMKVEACAASPCSGVTGPELAAVIVGVFIVGAAGGSLVGFGVGRMIRRLIPSLPGL